ncbi:MAG: indole-3-glycerol phosphate synthase TrpC [Bacteroidales bacterium]|nr:indole-3-glycerol phosphate synthase TrpC [Candidatus Sodaliphilus limicaballi]
MADILFDIVNHKRVEIAAARAALPLEQLQLMVTPLMNLPVPSMSKALSRSRSGIIAEFKRKSPSKGWIHEDAQVEDVTALYQAGGASAISILTDEKYFGGCDDFISRARACGVTIPVLYKNFIIDEYQLYQARLCGASAVLLIAACLTFEECRSLMDKAHALGLEVLLEMHSESELAYAELNPDMCGINNRNLGTFVTEVSNSFRMAQLLPDDAVKVSESGISDPDTVRQLREAGFRGFLIGEQFMKHEHPGEALKQFIEAL